MACNEDLIVWLIILLSWIEYWWEFYLNLRQFKIYQANNPVPDHLKHILTEESMKNACLYEMDRAKLKLASDFYTIALLCVLLYNQWIYLAWQTSENIADMLNITPDREICISCIFMTFVTLFTVSSNIPISIYTTFVLVDEYEFEKQTLIFFIRDQLKSFFFCLVITLPLTAAAIYIFMLCGNMLVFWLWLLTTIIAFIVLIIYPTVIAPLFDNIVTLPNYPLKKGIEDLTSKLHFPLSQIFVVEDSKRAAHSNAYYSGLFGGKKIVLFDTLLESYGKKKKVKTGCTNKEILAILAHELGHWSYSHMYKSAAAIEVSILLLFTAFGFLFNYSTLYTSIGFPAGQEPIIVSHLVILQLILAPFVSFLSFLNTALTRKFEFDADNLAISLNYANELQSALIKIVKDEVDYPIYDELYSTWYHSEPSLLQRIENIQKQKGNEKKD